MSLIVPASVKNPNRKQVILDLIRENKIESQFQLLSELRAVGINIGQSSISRDLDALGIAKVNGQYAVIPGERDDITALSGIDDVILDIETAGPNLTVVKTLPGGAQRVGHALDTISWPEVVGTVAGDDTIFIATDSSSSQDVLIKRFSRRLSR